MIKLLQGRAGVGVRERQDAKRQEDDVSLWRDYHTFLTAKTSLLSGRLAQAHSAFERSDADERAATQAQGALDRIPAGLRALFEAVVEERRGQIQQLMEMEARSSRGRQLDPDAVEERALQELLAEAEGQVETDSTPVGYGFFPRGAPGDVRWYALDVAELLAAPTAASYSLGAEPHDVRRRIMLSIGAGVFAIGFLLIWFLLPHGAATREQAALIPLVSDGTTAATPLPMDVWPIQRATLMLDNGPTRTISVAATTSATWPVATDKELAYWQRNAFAPLRLCLAPELLEHVTSLQLTGGGGWPDRIYTVSTAPSSIASLVLEECRASRTRRYAVLQQTPALPAQAIGTPVTLPGNAEETLTVQTITIAGPGQDPTFPAGQARIVVGVAARADLDWPAYAPTLLLPSGQAYLPAETVTQAQGAELRYLVPLPVTDTPLAWDLTVPGSGQIVRWRATLAPPLSRTEVLRDALAVQEISAQQQNSVVALSITIVNRGRTPLVLIRDDITLQLGERPISTPEIGALATPLAAGERRALSLTVSVLGGSRAALLITLGTQTYQITLSEGR